MLLNTAAKKKLQRNESIPAPTLDSNKSTQHEHHHLVHPEGTAHCLWTEALPLHELGRLEVTRASNIEFNNATQQWEVKDRRGRIRFIAKSRSACLEWEQQNLQPDEGKT